MQSPCPPMIQNGYKHNTYLSVQDVGFIPRFSNHMFVNISNSKRLSARLTNHLFVNINNEVKGCSPVFFFFFVWRYTQFRCFNPKRKWCLAQLIFWGKPNSKHQLRIFTYPKPSNSFLLQGTTNGGEHPYSSKRDIYTYKHSYTYIYISNIFRIRTRIRQKHPSEKTKHATQNNNGHH